MMKKMIYHAVENVAFIHAVVVYAVQEKKLKLLTKKDGKII